MKRQTKLSCVIIGCLLFAACGFNQVIDDDENVKAAWAEVENQYKRRSDLVPQLVSTVKGARDFEQETFARVAEARASVGKVALTGDAKDSAAKLKAFDDAQAQLGGALSRLLVVAERYPELKANANFRDLQAQLEGTENRIAVARRRFIETVAVYNKGVQRWPSAFGAWLRQKTVRPTLAAPAAATEAPVVTF